MSRDTLKDLVSEYVRHVKSARVTREPEPEVKEQPPVEQGGEDVDGDGSPDTVAEPIKLDDKAAAYAQSFQKGDKVRLASDNPAVTLVPLFDKRCGPVVKWIKSGIEVPLTSTPGPLNASISFGGKDYFVKLQHVKHIL